MQWSLNALPLHTFVPGWRFPLGRPSAPGRAWRRSRWRQSFPRSRGWSARIPSFSRSCTWVWRPSPWRSARSIQTCSKITLGRKTTNDLPLPSWMRWRPCLSSRTCGSSLAPRTARTPPSCPWFRVVRPAQVYHRQLRELPKLRARFCVIWRKSDHSVQWSNPLFLWASSVLGTVRNSILPGPVQAENFIDQAYHQTWAGSWRNKNRKTKQLHKYALMGHLAGK